jgi:predicted transposase YbfD/YdcC
MTGYDFFAGVTDIRVERNKLHKLSDILFLSLCAVISGADDCEEIAAYGCQKEAFLRQFIELANGIPSHDTINRVFKWMDKDEFNDCLHRWSAHILEFTDQYQLNIDGKVLRGTAKSGKKKSGICLISAWVESQRLVLGQLKAEEKSTEKTAIPELLQSLDLKDAVVSIDAIACTRQVAGLIKEKQGDYLLALKKNQKQLFEQVNDHMQVRKRLLESHPWQDFGSGRLETRTCYVLDELRLLDDLADWPGIRQVVMVESQREKDGKTVSQTRFYLSSLEATAKEFNVLVRNHWSIENKLHWMLDVVFREDQSRTRTGNAPENMATLRKMALQVLNQQNDKNSIKNRRKIAAWNDNYLLQLLKNADFMCV